MASVVKVAPSAARTVTGNSGYVPTPTGSGLSLLVNVTAASGTTPSMALTVEWTNDGINFAQANPADTFVAITGVGAQVTRFAQKAAGYRVVWTLTGTTPNFTFDITSDVDGAGFIY